MPGLGYDEQGGLAAYFGITFLSLALVPWTLHVVRRAALSSVKRGKQRLRECGCEQCRRKGEEVRRWESKERSWTRAVGLTKGNAALVIGWLAFAALAYVIAQSPSTASTIYDPFEILGLSSSSDDKAIKRHYKKLSLKFHPDKIKLTGNDTLADAEAKFVELTKAYKSLTDEAIRENLAKYGNPDGQQPREERIAIPQWVVEGRHGMWTLAVYALLLGAGVPWLVGSWWFSQRSVTKDGIQNETAELFFKGVTEDATTPRLVGLLASSVEYRTMLGGAGHSKKDRRSRVSQTEELEKRIRERSQQLGQGDVLAQAQKTATTAPARRAQALLWSHLYRMDLGDADLAEERRRVLLKLPLILPALLNIALAHHWLATSRQIMTLSARFVQATPGEWSAIMQLPDRRVEDAVGLQASELYADGWQTSVVESTSATTVTTEKPTAPGQPPAPLQFTYADRSTASKIPRLRITDATFSVEGENEITPGSFIQFTYACHVIQDHPAAGQQKTKKGADGKDEIEVPDVYAHAPRWPAVSSLISRARPSRVPELLIMRRARSQHRKPAYWVFLADTASGRIIVQPQRIADLPIQSPSAAASGEKPAVKTFKLGFQAPPSASVHRFTAYWISDSYLLAGAERPITLTVEDPASLRGGDDEDVQDDISEPDEDSLAGQLAAMKGEKVKRRVEAYSDDDDESGEEEEEDGDGYDTSDTEGDARRAKGGDDTSSDEDSD